jgi:flagellar hook-associated protein 2
MDWRSVVDQLMQLDRVPQDRLRTQQTSITQQSTALDRIKGKLSTLQGSLADLAFSSSSASTRSTSVLNSIYQEYTGGVVSASRVNQSPTATVTATSSAPLGLYEVEVKQMGSPYTVVSANTARTNVEETLLKDLPLGAAITEGSIFIDGSEVTVGAGKDIDPATMTVRDLIGYYDETEVPDTVPGFFSGFSINANITGGYLELSSSNPFFVNTSADSSNLMKLLGLTASEVSGGPTKYISPVALGNFSLNTKISDLANTLDDSALPLPDSSGSFKINGAQISWTGSDTISSVVAGINSADAGVSASYSRVDGRLMLVSKEGGKPIVFSDDVGNLLQSLGVADAPGSSSVLGLSKFSTSADNVAFASGRAYEYTVKKDGVQLGGKFQSVSDTLDLSEAGFEGVSVRVSETGRTTFSVASDSSAAFAKVKSFIDAYNAVRQDIEDSTKVTSVDGKVTTSVLSGNRDLMGVASSLRKFIFTPMTGPTLAVTTTSGSTELTVTGAGLSALKVGAEISGAGIPSGAKVTAIDASSNKVTISSAATASAAGVSLKSSSTARYTQMEQLGLAFRGTSGDLYIKDSGKLQTALASYSSDVEKFFTSAGVAATSTGTTTFDSVYPTQGVAERLDNYLNKIIGYNGLFEIQKKSLTSRSKTIDKQIADMERLLKQRQAALERSFIQMEQAQQQVQTQLSALTGSLSGFSSSSSKK